MVQELTLLSKEVRFPDSAPAAYPVFFRTYSRKYNNKRESWAEVCDRTLTGLKTLGKLTQAQADLIDKMQKQLKSLTSGRWLWVGGTEWVDRPENFSGSYNCTSTNVIDWRSFGLMMDLAMQGSGTGGVLEPQYISQLPVIRNQLQVNVIGAIGDTPTEKRRHNTEVQFDYANNAVKFFVGDSRQGWVKSYQSLLELCSDEQFDAAKPVQVTVDISDVRPSGEALKGFGGMANPVKLPTLYDRCANILNKAIGRQLTSVECCILIDEAAVCIVAGNIRRCLPEDALVHTSKGLVAIKDVQVGDLVQTPLGFRTVLNKFDHGMQEVQEIETNATFPRATINHRVAVLSDAKGSIRWKYVAALDEGDRLMHSNQILSGTVTYLPEDDTEQRPVNSRNAKSLTIPVLTPEVAWLIGFTHGDGYVALGRNKHDKPYGRVEWAMNATQPELCQKLQAKLDQVLAMFGLTATHGVVKGENTAKTVCTSIRLAEYFHKHIKQPNTVLEVPSFILQGSTDIRSAYLAGLMDSDGAVNNRPPQLISSVYRQFVRQVSAVLSSLGIAGRINITIPKEENWQAKYNLTIPAFKEQYNALISQHSVKGEIRQGLKMYGFTIAAEMMREVYTYSEMRDMGFQGSRSVNSNYERYIAESDVSMDIPVSVKGLGSHDYVQTYDIEVEEAHCFYCDGYLTHNSAGMRQFSSEDALGSVAKDNLWQQDEAGNWRIDPERDALRMANHTRVFHRKPTEQECVDAVRKQYYSGEGAIQWAGEAIARSNADLITTPELKRNFLAAYVKGEGKEWLRSQQPEVSEHELEHRLQRYALNPCLTADTWVHTEHGARQISDLIGQQVGVYVNGELFSTTADGFFLTGNKPVVSLQTKEGFALRLTDNHQLLKVTAQTQHAQYTEWVETKDLQIGDRILLHDHREIQSWEGEGSFEEGWLVGNLLGDGSLYQTQWNNAACLRYWGETKEEMASYAIKTLEYATNYQSQNSTGHYHKQLQHQVINSSGLATLAAKFGLSPQNKVLSSAIEKASYAFYCGFLRGFFDADGSVQGKQEKGVSVRLAQSNLETLQAVQRMLARVGIISSVYQQRRPAGVRMLPNSDRELAPYMCKEQHELVIANDNLQHFAVTIGFQDPLKADRLKESLGNYSRKMNRERFTATITSITADGVEPVYDCTVPQVSRFDANGIVAHNCGEILGADFHCNLSEVHLNLINPKDEKEQEAAFKAGALSVASLLNHQFIEKRYQFSRDVDPIVGVSFTGLFDFFVHAFGVEWLRWFEAGRPDTVQGLDFKEKEADYLNRWREIVHQTVWEYCDSHGLRRPNRCTTTQPAGTKSLLTGASPGWHPPKAQRFIRRITFRKEDPVARACMDYGYSIIPSQSDKDENGQLLNDPFDPRCTEWLVEIPVSVTWADLDGADLVEISKFDVMAQFDFYMQVQKFYTRHNTSATLELREHEIEPLGKKIYEAIRDDEGYISAALLARFDDLQTFPRLPFEPIDKATYEKLSAEVLVRRQSDDFYASLLRYDSGELMDAGPAGCDSDKCMFPEQKP
jgi:intein/homing endonuclease